MNISIWGLVLCLAVSLESRADIDPNRVHALNNAPVEERFQTSPSPTPKAEMLPVEQQVANQQIHELGELVVGLDRSTEEGKNLFLDIDRAKQILNSGDEKPLMERTVEVAKLIEDLKKRKEILRPRTSPKPGPSAHEVAEVIGGVANHVADKFAELGRSLLPSSSGALKLLQGIRVASATASAQAVLNARPVEVAGRSLYRSRTEPELHVSIDPKDGKASGFYYLPKNAAGAFQLSEPVAGLRRANTFTSGNSVLAFQHYEITPAGTVAIYRSGGRVQGFPVVRGTDGIYYLAR